MPVGLPILAICQFRSLRQAGAVHHHTDGLDVGIKIQLSEDSTANAVLACDGRRSMTEMPFSRLGGQHHDNLAIWLRAHLSSRIRGGIQSPSFADRIDGRE